MIKRIATGLAVVLATVALSATPADARPVNDPPVYNGPAYGTSSWFAGRTATGCVKVYSPLTFQYTMRCFR